MVGNTIIYSIILDTLSLTSQNKKLALTRRELWTIQKWIIYEKWGGVTALLASTLAFANSVEAISLIGNYQPTNDDTGNVINGLNQKAVGFTPTGTSYVLDNIILRLSGYDTTDTPQLQIYSGGTNTPPIGASLPVSFTSNTPSSVGSNNFTFTPTSTFTFAADTRYWLVVSGAGTNYVWRGSNPIIAPSTTAISSFDGYAVSINGGTSYTANSLPFNTFEINATAVPFEFEATGGLVMLGGAWLLHKHLQKKKT